MSRVVVLGATGMVGRPLVAELARRAGTEVVAVGRNRVLLDHLAAEHPVEPLHLDVMRARPRDLPEADLVVDLTNSLNRHPRWVVQAAERTIAFLADYLGTYRGARVVHTGSFALLTPRPELADRLAGEIIWDGTYLISKSAGERAVARRGLSGRLQVIRLGNMAVPDMVWTTAILRAVRDGAVANPGVLGQPAVLTDHRQLADALFEERPDLSYIPEMAGFTWGEVINAVARASGQHELAAGEASELDVPAPRLGPLMNRAFYAAPLAMASGPVEALPGASVWLAGARALVRRQKAGPAPFPVALPQYRQVPGAGRDERRLDDLVRNLAALFADRGWAPIKA